MMAKVYFSGLGKNRKTSTILNCTQIFYYNLCTKIKKVLFHLCIPFYSLDTIVLFGLFFATIDFLQKIVYKSGTLLFLHTFVLFGHNCTLWTLSLFRANIASLWSLSTQISQIKSTFIH